MVSSHFHLLRVGAGCSTLISRKTISLASNSLYFYPLIFPKSQIINTIVEATKSLYPDVIRKRVEEVMDVDVSEELSHVAIPSLYLRASHDRVVPRAASELISSILPDIQIKTLDGPHFLLQVAPVESGEIVAEFIREVESASNNPLLLG
jgi:pimeloyl-ACP methyl ester carboxylesterase